MRRMAGGRMRAAVRLAAVGALAARAFALP